MSETEAPAWATSEDSAGKQSVPVPEGSSSTDIRTGIMPSNSFQRENPFSPAATPAESAEVVQLAESGDLPKYLIMLRLGNMAAMVLIMVASVLQLMSVSGLTNIVYATYAFLFALLVFCFEIQLKYVRTLVAVNFGFFYSPFCRFIFDGVLATMTWELGLLGIIAGISVIGLACVNIYVLCKYSSSYWAVRELIAEEEDKRIEEKVKGEIERKVMNDAASFVSE